MCSLQVKLDDLRSGVRSVDEQLQLLSDDQLEGQVGIIKVNPIPLYCSEFIFNFLFYSLSISFGPITTPSIIFPRSTYFS